MFTNLRQHKKWLTAAGVAFALIASLVLVWVTMQIPERGRNALVAGMEKDSDLFFATERDIGALAQDAKSGAAKGIGLSAEYALVSLENGGRYYVRIDTQHALVTELLKDRLSSTASVVFSLDDVQPATGPLNVLLRWLSPNLLSLIGPLLIIYLIFLMNPGRGAGAMFKSVDKPPTRFKDVIGVLEAKEALEDIVAYLKNPAKFSELGAKPPRGVVLEGHFGSGKTLLARAVAGEAGVPCFSLSGSDFSDMFLGVGVRRVKKLFAQARKHAPCVVFIDEIDGLGRRSSGSSAGETENNRIVNALLPQGAESRAETAARTSSRKARTSERSALISCIRSRSIWRSSVSTNIAATDAVTRDNTASPSRTTITAKARDAWVLGMMSP